MLIMSGRAAASSAPQSKPPAKYPYFPRGQAKVRFVPIHDPATRLPVSGKRPTVQFAFIAMSKKSKSPVVLAIAAHPDDIEFMAAGTLLLLKEAGCETHYLNVASGNCGSVRHDAATTRKMRAAEGRRAARLLGAHFHPSLADDLEIVYDLKILRRLAAVVRAVKPA